MKRCGRLILWVGQRHSGKTTSAGRLVSRVRGEGFSVCGLLAPSVYEDGELAGFDAVDIRTGRRAALARRSEVEEGGRFAFLTEGLEVGREALGQEVVESADIVVIDEFGPVELGGGGWRAEVERVLERTGVIVMLVVRRESAAEVCGLYRGYGPEKLRAADSASVERVLGMVRERRELSSDQ
jgi:nucleoside-triphosphatase THEP1